MVSTRKSRSGLLDETEVDLDSSPVTANKRSKKLPVRAKEDESSPAASKNNKVVFGDDDDVPAPKSATKKRPAPKQEESDDESSDDDAAPEAVSTSAAAASVKQNAAAAQKVAQEKAATQKRKRQERDALLKQQAEERKAANEAEEDEETAAVVEQPKKKKQRNEKILFPSTLPEEFLTDSASEDELLPEDEDRVVKRRKVAGVEKKLSKSDKAPRDVTVGSTVYRVAKKVDERLAPKAMKHASGGKEALLRRGRVAVPGNKMKAGFLKR